MGELLRHVLPLALGAAVSPTVLTVAVLTLTARQKPVVRGALFAAGVVVALVVLSALGLTVMSHVTDHPSSTQRAVSDGVDATFGLVLLALGVRSLLRRRAEASDHEPAAMSGPDAAKPDTDPERTGLVAAFVTGIVMMATNVTSIVLYLPAMKDAANSHVSDTDKALVVAIAIVIASLPAWLPVVSRIVAPGPAQRLLTQLDGTIQRHKSAIVTTVEVLFGAYLLARGFGA